MYDLNKSSCSCDLNKQREKQLWEKDKMNMNDIGAVNTQLAQQQVQQYFTLDDLSEQILHRKYNIHNLNKQIAEIMHSAGGKIQ